MNSSYNIGRAILFLLGISIALLFLSGCGQQYVFQKEYPIADAKWSYSDTLDFDLTIEDTTDIYNIYLDITHTVDYSKQNLYALVYTKFPSGERLKEQVSLELANKLGLWNGDCKGESCTVRIPLQVGAYFNKKGNYTFTIEQFMRINPLEGIQKIGLVVEDTSQNR